jgi:hypothetical protein
MVVERLTGAYRSVEISGVWRMTDPTPVDVLHRNFWFTSIEDPATFRNVDVIGGAGKVMVVCDYLRQDSTWPDLQSILRRDLRPSRLRNSTASASAMPSTSMEQLRHRRVGTGV